jgi:hypothetical protein
LEQDPLGVAGVSRVRTQTRWGCGRGRVGATETLHRSLSKLRAILDMIRPTPRQNDIIEKISGRRPICRAKYISRCCDGPVDVYHGKMTGTPKDWSVAIVRRCALCGKECEGYYPGGTR